MEPVPVGSNVTVELDKGDLVVRVKSSQYISKFLDKTQADIESGALDPIKGTDIDKVALLGAIQYLRELVDLPAPSEQA